jgi:hypothetical protein
MFTGTLTVAPRGRSDVALPVYCNESSESYTVTENNLPLPDGIPATVPSIPVAVIVSVRVILIISDAVIVKLAFFASFENGELGTADILNKAAEVSDKLSSLILSV